MSQATVSPNSGHTDLQEFYEETLLNERKSHTQKVLEAKKIADRWEINPPFGQLSRPAPLASEVGHFSHQQAVIRHVQNRSLSSTRTRAWPVDCLPRSRTAQRTIPPRPTSSRSALDSWCVCGHTSSVFSLLSLRLIAGRKPKMHSSPCRPAMDGTQPKQQREDSKALEESRQRPLRYEHLLVASLLDLEALDKLGKGAVNYREGEVEPVLRGRRGISP